MPPRLANLNRPTNGTAPATVDSQTFVVRSSPTPVSHRTFLRVHIPRANLGALDLQANDIVQLCVEDESDGSIAREVPAIVWLADQKTIQQSGKNVGNVALVSEGMRRMLGVSFGDKIRIARYPSYPEPVEHAESVMVREVEEVREGEFGQTVLKPVEANMSKREAEGWGYFLEHIAFEAKCLACGYVFSPIEYKGKKRSFRVESILPASKFDLKAPAYRVTNQTTIKLGGYDPDESEGSTVVTSKSEPPKTTFASVGGLSDQISKLKTELLSTINHSKAFIRANLPPPRGILLYGPPGTGKTLLLRAIASEVHAKTFVLDGSIAGKYMGESEAAVRKIFAEARKNQPAIIFMDEVDSIAPKRSTGEGSEGRVVATLLTEMDGMAMNDDGTPLKIAVVAATNRPNAIDEALRRPGRFEKEIEIGIPDAGARREILGLLMKELQMSGVDKDVFLPEIAGRTHGYVGADLVSLVRGAFTIALKRAATDDDDANIILTPSDFESALKDIRPTAMRDIFLETPAIHWSDIGGQSHVKQRLIESVSWPLLHPQKFKDLGIVPHKGLLLYGPPGCSKTLTAKALATEAGLNFIAVKGPELFSMYVGESERAVREVFRKARQAAPSIIFFDEIDALTQTREGHGRGGPNVLTAMLNEMDGIEALNNVTILAATNRPEIIDPALLRPGRLDSILYVGPPDLDARREILRIKTGKMKLAEDVDLEGMAEAMEGLSGAEIVNLCNEAAYAALRESLEVESVGKRHFEEVVGRKKPMITEEMKRRYEEWSAEREGDVVGCAHH